jgi:hypothetical protein
VLGRVHSGRIDAALERLRGTDVIMASFVAPLVVDHSHTDAIAIRLDRRIIDLVRSSRKAKAMIDIKVPPMRALSSRWSAALYGRFLSWENHVYPASPNIRFGAHPRGRAFELDVPTASLPDVFGFDGAMRPFEIANRFITSTPRCPLQRELGKAMVAVDTAVLGSEIAPKGMHGLRIRMSEITTRVVDLAAADKHRSIRRTHRQAIRAI